MDDNIVIPSRSAATFWKKVSRGGLYDCWEWTGAVGSKGYGQMNVLGRTYSVPRLAYYLHHGTWPEPCCLHTCDNRLCVNPAHLEAGTVKENTQQMWERGRANPGPLEARICFGSENKEAVLNEWQVIGIMGEILQGKTVREVARGRGLRLSCVKKIASGERWAWLWGEKSRRKSRKKEQEPGSGNI